jgi:exopolysaccharide biosynthesis polyprenyl glycosylphosphotransferase
MATEPILSSAAELEARSPIAVAPASARANSSVGSRSVASSPGTLAARFGDALGQSTAKKLIFLAGDVAAVIAAHWLAETWARHRMHLPALYLNPSGYFLFYVPFLTALLYLLESHKSPDLRRPEKELELLAKGVSISFVALACANFVIFKSSGFSRYLLVAWYALTLVFLLAARFGLRAAYGALWRRGLARQKTLLIGAPARLADFQMRLAIQRYQGCQIVGLVTDSDAGPDAALSADPGISLPVLGSLDDWQSIAQRQGVRRIVVCRRGSGANHSAWFLDLIRRCQQSGIEIEAYSTLLGSAGIRTERDDFTGFIRFYSPSASSRVAQLAAKSALDFAIGAAGSLVTLALTPVIGLCIKLEDGGSVFHRREYVGTDGRVHHFLKFRTMVENAEQILEHDAALKAEFESSFKLRNDPRVLRCGRFLRKYSLDEFPQFFCLLTGELTFVGPRAITPAARARYGELLPKLLSMKPGLTGFWQVMGRQTTTYEEKIQMDMFYIDHWSIWLDLVILAKTFWAVLRAQGAY